MENNGTTETALQVVTPDALYLITKAEVDIQISTAKTFPRSLQEFLLRAMSMATLNEDIAASCSYSLPRGGKSLDGPSVRLAEIVCAAYRNIRSGSRVIANDGKTITAQGICHDLENNNSVTVEVKRKITDRNGKTFNEDMQVVTGNAACAIAYRNAVFKVVPAALVQDVYDKAREVAKGTAETLIKRRDKAVEYFRGLKVTDVQICEALAIKKVEDIDLDKLAILTGMKAAIKNGEATVQSLFEPQGGQPADKQRERVELLLKDIVTVGELNALAPQIPPQYQELYEAKKRELEQPSTSKLFTEEIRQDITICETIAQVNAIAEAHPELKDDIGFKRAVNQKKIVIGNPQKKTA